MGMMPQALASSAPFARSTLGTFWDISLYEITVTVFAGFRI